MGNGSHGQEETCRRGAFVGFPLRFETFCFMPFNGGYSLYSGLPIVGPLNYPPTTTHEWMNLFRPLLQYSFCENVEAINLQTVQLKWVHGYFYYNYFSLSVPLMVVVLKPVLANLWSQGRLTYVPSLLWTELSEIGNGPQIQ